MKKFKIALDAMGCDAGAQTLVDGSILALNALREVDIVLVGQQQILKSLLRRNGFERERISIQDAEEVVNMDESPKESLKKRFSSIAVAAELVKNGVVQALVSAGNTGATLAHTLTRWRTITGVKRPAAAALLPTRKEPVVLIDVGANVDCRPEHLLQFAIMGSIYAQKVLHRSHPRVGLLSIGEELSKGNKLTLHTQQLLTRAPINFHGNAEGRDILSGEFDVIVCDGFMGNVLLKFGEAAVELLFSSLKQGLRKNPLATIGAIPLQPVFKGLIKKVDYTEYGGVPLLGVDGVAIVSHGQSSPKAIKNAIRVACEFVKNNVNEHIKQNIESMMIYAPDTL